MARLQSLSSTVDEYKGWLIVGGVGFVLWSFRGFFSAVGGAAGAGAENLLGGIQEQAKLKTDKAKAKAATGSKREFSAEEIATFRADAASLAEMLGRGPGVGMKDFVKDQQGAFTIIKQKYSRLNLYNNKPCKWADASKKKIVSQTAETTASIKNDVNWRVLEPFYSEASGGHSLNSDFRYYVTASKYTVFFKWIL